jgi:hypothetical protein
MQLMWRGGVNGEGCACRGRRAARAERRRAAAAEGAPAGLGFLLCTTLPRRAWGAAAWWLGCIVLCVRYNHAGGFSLKPNHPSTKLHAGRQESRPAESIGRPSPSPTRPPPRSCLPTPARRAQAARKASSEQASRRGRCGRPLTVSLQQVCAEVEQAGDDAPAVVHGQVHLGRKVARLHRLRAQDEVIAVVAGQRASHVPEADLVHSAAAALGGKGGQGGVGAGVGG